MIADPCAKCGGSGHVRIGRTSGICFRCVGKGFRSEADDRRNAAYDRYRSRLARTAYSAGDAGFAAALLSYAR